ncbi:MAG: GNAT family N-acetyltransferase [Nanoarchaeota archaeon]|nr:GNAT family N-acetyltransferase [Nanoarchaeota archaeon]
MLVCPFLPSEASQVSALIKTTLTKANSKDYPKEVLKHQIEHYSEENILRSSKDKTILLAIEGKEIIGTASIKDNWVSGVFVHPDHMSKGVGKALMERIEAIAKDNGFSTIKLGSSTTAQGFYRKLGYKEIKEIVDEKVGKVIQMEKAL